MTPSSPAPADELATLRAERDALRSRLQESDARLRRLYDDAPLGIAVVSFTEARYVYLNEAHVATYERPREYFTSTDPYQVWVDVTSPEDFDTERGLLQQLADGRRDRYALEKSIRLPSGALRKIRITVSATRDALGRMHEIVVMTESRAALYAEQEARRSLEEQLRRSQKLEVVGRMAGGVAHDFNNRLLIVLGYAELLKLELHDPKLREYVDLIAGSAERSAELTRQLLAFSRRQVLSPKSVNVAEALSRMRRMLESLLSDSVQIVTDLHAEARIFCDPGQLEQVVMNLAINARDAMPSGGVITFRSRDVAAGAAELPSELSSRTFVALEVSDLGGGISPAVLPHVFEPFYTTKEVGRGTGLGLSTVDGIVRQSGGHVTVQTRLGAGTTFTVYLPAADTSGSVEPAPPASLSIETREGRLGTVLVCDDDAAVRELVGVVLGFGAYRILLAGSAAEALTAFETEPQIDVLVTDLVMPGQSGVDLARAVRKRHPRTLVLFISGYAGESELSAISGEELLTKPFLPAALLKRVRQLLEARDHREPAALTASP